MLKNNLRNALTDVSSKHQKHVQVLKIQCAMITDDGTSYSKKLNLGYCRSLPDNRFYQTGLMNNSHIIILVIKEKEYIYI